MSLTDRLSGLVNRVRRRWLPASRLPTGWPNRALREGSKAGVTSSRAIGQSIDLFPDIPLQDAAPLNAGRCRFDVYLDVITDPRSGGYSTIVPVPRSARHQGPALFRCDLELVDGSVGLSAVTADCKIIAERVANKRARQQLEIIVSDSRDVAGIMVRNSAVTGHPSRVIVERIRADSYATEKLLRIRKDRPSRLLRLPVRKQSNEELQETGESIIASIDLDTAATATIIIDAWKKLGDRVALNVSAKLAPTLTALRSSGMAILHAPHDCEVHALVQPLAGETEIPGEFHDTDILARMLSDAGIRNLIYLGYFSNMCILQRSVGMLEMHKRGFNTILVRDASLAKESKDSMVGEWFHRATVHFVELNFGATTTAAEIRAAVAAMSADSA